MGKKDNIRWTPLQQEIADKLGQGKYLRDLIQEGYTTSLVSKVIKAWKRGFEPPSDGGDENQEPQKLAGKPIEVSATITRELGEN